MLANLAGMSLKVLRIPVAVDVKHIVKSILMQLQVKLTILLFMENRIYLTFNSKY